MNQPKAEAVLTNQKPENVSTGYGKLTRVTKTSEAAGGVCVCLPILIKTFSPVHRPALILTDLLFQWVHVLVRSDICWRLWLQVETSC